MKNLLLVLLTLLAFNAYAIEEKEFGEWRVRTVIDDFEGDVMVGLVSNIVDTKGKEIGAVYITLSSSTFEQLAGGMVTFVISGLDHEWPYCDYENMKYKIDEAPSDFYPSDGVACPTNLFTTSMARKFSKGSQFRMSAKNKTGVVDLAGFTKAWKYAKFQLAKK